MRFYCLMTAFLLMSFSVLDRVTAQTIPAGEIIDVENLKDYLKEEVKNQLKEKGALSQVRLAGYMREKFSERFFYDYRTLEERLALYNNTYGREDEHRIRALDHMGKFADSTQWLLPFNYLNGAKVNAYALRHLARQHKMVDVAFLYFINEKNPEYIRYFEGQMRSLNHALITGQYERIEDGNGVYEVFRSGYRILNWLWIHNMLLNEREYSDEDQLRTIATLLQHGAHLYERNAGFRPGNHQTKGMSSLAMLSILLRDFVDTDLWYSRAMERLEEHLLKEINADGFQFERSVHYHMSDINNYFYVFQLAKISGLEVSKVWEDKLRSLFTTLVKIAYPDKTAPVLQDDTEIPWGEKNKIDGALTLGYLLFEDPEFGYFANDRVDASMYWFLQQRQVELLKNIKHREPTYGSLAFSDTDYYIMREGWNKGDKMMIISAGLDEIKPDHQHGDMLGIQAIANGHIILPNYQVRYSLGDLELFKNSMVKNVALVDHELQGKQWTANKGGSGFGKFRELPNPETIVWQSNEDFDLFTGSHDGFENIGVSYTRQVIYIKDDFWIVRDRFRSEEPHTYKQVWQGHYTAEEGPNLIRSSFDDGNGCDIFQLNDVDAMTVSGARGKQWTVVIKEGERNFDFLTIVFPFNGYDNRINETDENISLGGWKINQSEWQITGDSHASISKDYESYFFGVSTISIGQMMIQTEKSTDLFIRLEGKDLIVKMLGDAPQEISISGTAEGQSDNQAEMNKYNMKPGDVLIVRL